MKHRFSLEGWCYRLRPVRLTDAQFIIDVRLEDQERNRFIHTISRGIEEQKRWIEDYFQREGDYYFVVENRLTACPEGLIAFYDEAEGRAEWGRWVLKKGSMAAAESVYLLYRIAFEQAGLKELYCRTIADNASVVSFHTSIGELTRTVIKNAVKLNGALYDVVEQYADRKQFGKVIEPCLEKQAAMIFRRSLKKTVGNFTFHHLGVATRGILKELPQYLLLGYEKEGEVFEDPQQGIRGLFLTAPSQPRLELLENLEGSHTLDKQLEQGQKLYHAAYYVTHIEKAAEVLQRNRARIISPMKQSVYFGKRICFLMLSNMMMIELLEE